MKGKPHRLNSKADYYYIKENFERDYWRPLWENMFEIRMIWQPTDLLPTPEDGIEDETHRVVTHEPSEEGGTPTYQQEEYILNPLSDFVRMGFTEEEVLQALSE
jgi:hypothetical protein